MNLLEQTSHRATKKFETRVSFPQAKRTIILFPAEEKAQENLAHMNKYWRGRKGEEGAKLFLEEPTTGQLKYNKLCVNMRRYPFHCEGSQTLAQIF